MNLTIKVTREVTTQGAYYEKPKTLLLGVSIATGSQR